MNPNYWYQTGAYTELRKFKTFFYYFVQLFEKTLLLSVLQTNSNISKILGMNEDLQKKVVENEKQNIKMTAEKISRFFSDLIVLYILAD